MKKNLLIIFVSILVLSCSNVVKNSDDEILFHDKTIKEIYEKVAFQLSLNDNYAIDGIISQNIIGVDKNLTITSNLKIRSNLDLFYASLSFNEEESYTNIWASNNYIYIDNQTEKYKLNMSLDEYINTQSSIILSNDSLIMNLEDKVYNQFSINEYEDSYELYVNLDPSVYLNFSNNSSLSEINDDNFQEFKYYLVLDLLDNLKQVRTYLKYEASGYDITLSNEFNYTPSCDYVPSIPTNAEYWSDYTSIYKN